MKRHGTDRLSPSDRKREFVRISLLNVAVLLGTGIAYFVAFDQWFTWVLVGAITAFTEAVLWMRMRQPDGITGQQARRLVMLSVVIFVPLVLLLAVFAVREP